MGGGVLELWKILDDRGRGARARSEAPQTSELQRVCRGLRKYLC
jgi:hypothetical protein